MPWVSLLARRVLGAVWLVAGLLLWAGWLAVRARSGWSLDRLLDPTPDPVA